MKNTDLTHEQLLKKVEKQEKELAQQAELQDNLAMLKEVTHNMGDMVALFSMEGTIKYASPSFERVLGYQPEVGQDMMEYVHPEDKENLLPAMTKFIKDHVTQTHELRIRKADGSYLNVETISNIQRNDNGETTGFITSTRDITERKKMHQTLKQSEERFEAFMNNLPAAAFIKTKKNQLLYCNEQFSMMLHTSPERIIGTYIDENISPELEKVYEQENKDVIENGKLLKTESIFSYDGKDTYWLTYKFPIKMETEILLGAISINVTDRKRVEKQLEIAKENAEESENFLQTIFENIPNMIFMKKADDLSFAFFNKAGEKLLGYKSDELIGKNDYDFFPKEQADYFVEKDRNVLKGKEILSIEEEEINTKSGKRYLSTKKLTIHNSEGKPKYLFGISEDITKYKESEQELIRAKEQAENANRLKTEFLHNMSHEIRTPLNGIIGFAEILNNPKLSEEKRKNYSNIIRNSGEQLLRIIDDILEISKLETKQRKLDETEFCLNQLLIELFAIFSLKSKEMDVTVYLEKALQDKQSHIISDKTKLNKILSNLIENAIKFTSSGSIEIGYTIEKELLKLYVKDTGIGISAENQQKIFERFSQEDKDIAGTYGGLGLGLSICKENAQLLGGDITLESQKGSGSTFYVTIPYNPVEDSIIDKSKTTSKNIEKGKPKTILVAEDEVVNYMYIEALFEDELDSDCNLIHAKNGREALDICMENKNIDIVLMDIKMPVMNGNEATLKIKKELPHLPVIAQTAYSTESEKRDAMKHGYDDFMSKPLDKDKLFETINKFMSIK